ncbi:HTTM domain-containing protein [Aquimarina agarivorans]|uniref:HTTM domain-containing protein n=1 Tax=Aquimarina agarivorans TaxID=980584 RepID=UPI000248FDC8|nr:HTTM domain-containing protein [Aquimarina agarivorans]
MLNNYLHTNTKAAPLAVFRFLFGWLMLASTLRFWFNGWIKSIYIAPKWFFTYYGFEFVKPLGNLTYLLFFIIGVTSVAIALGYYYKYAIVIFFLSFTYVELIDKTTYLNHYYFVSLVSFVLIFLPANVTFSIDARKSTVSKSEVPRWTIDVLKLLIAIVYVYAGVAKLNSDWLLEALPLKIWLINKTHFPVIGTLFQYEWSAYAFSWLGMLYDLTIPFFLMYKPTRRFAFIAVVIFHMLTYMLFQIGIFPFVMTLAVFVYFSPAFHEKLIHVVSSKIKLLNVAKSSVFEFSAKAKRIIYPILGCFVIFQLVFPWRYLCYPGELFWTEEGYRFSWRVMLIEKMGTAVFTIKDPIDGKSFNIRNADFLTPFQIKQMATQPDFILQYAHMLRDHYKKEGVKNPEVYVESYVTLNRRLSKQFIDPKTNLANEKDSFAPKKWILPFNGTIKGL